MRYVCPMCGSEHGELDEAVSCCLHKLREKIVSECPFCRTWYDCPEDAMTCCGIEQVAGGDNMNPPTFSCCICQKLHPWPSAALECCQDVARVKVKYRCPTCAQLHDTHNTAVTCCETLVRVVLQITCKQCGFVWNNTDSAMECCAHLKQKEPT